MLDRLGEKGGNGLEDIEQSSQELRMKLRLHKKWRELKEKEGVRGAKALELPFDFVSMETL